MQTDMLADNMFSILCKITIFTSLPISILVGMKNQNSCNIIMGEEGLDWGKFMMVSAEQQQFRSRKCILKAQPNSVNLLVREAESVHQNTANHEH